MVIENCWSCLYAQVLEGNKMMCRLSGHVKKSNSTCEQWSDLDGD